MSALCAWRQPLRDSYSFQQHLPAVDPAFPSPEEDALTIEQTHPSHRLAEGPLRELVRHVIEEEGCSLRTLTIVLADHATVLALNREYLDHDYHTDVLSFPLGAEDKDVVEGEVYVDLDTAYERHGEFGTSFEEEAKRYVVHGVLHLIGYDDTRPEEKVHLRRLEDRYLSAR